MRFISFAVGRATDNANEHLIVGTLMRRNGPHHVINIVSEGGVGEKERIYLISR